MQDLFKLLPKLIEQFEDSDEVREAVVLASWKKAAGDSLSNQTTAIELNGKTLTVAVKDAVWKKHLEALAGQMIFKLNSIIGRAAVTYIDFWIDEGLVGSHSKTDLGEHGSGKTHEEIALSEVSPRLRASAANIEDADLRNQFLLAAGSCLARKKRMAETK